MAPQQPERGLYRSLHEDSRRDADIKASIQEALGLLVLALLGAGLLIVVGELTGWI